MSIYTVTASPAGVPVCVPVGVVVAPSEIGSIMFTINAPEFGGAMLNGLNQVKVYATREQAEEYLGIYTNNVGANNLFVSEVYFVGDVPDVSSDSFKAGARYALEYLEELFEGVADTDIWADFFEGGVN